MQPSSLFFVLVLLSLGNNSNTDIWNDEDINIDDSGTYFDNEEGKEEGLSNKTVLEEGDSEGNSYEDYYEDEGSGDKDYEMEVRISGG